MKNPNTLIGKEVLVKIVNTKFRIRAVVKAVRENFGRHDLQIVVPPEHGEGSAWVAPKNVEEVK